MTLDEALDNEDEILTHLEVQRELKKHGFTLAEFIADHGHKTLYSPAEVLGWLGY